MGDLRPIQSPDAIKDFNYSEGEKARIAELRAGAIIGTGETVYEQLSNMAGNYGIDEVVVLTWTHDQEDRRNSYRLLAEAKQKS